MSHRRIVMLTIAAVVSLAGVSIAIAQSLLHPQAGEFAEDDFVAVKTCKMCHQTQHGQWEGTLHAHSADDPFYLRVTELAAKDMPGVEDFCANCHAPVVVFTGQDPLDVGNLSGAAENGLQCDFCHTVSAMDHIGNSGFVSTPGIVKFGPFDVTPELYHDARQSPLHESAEFCGTCHNVTHPTSGVELEATYTEYINGPYPEEGVVCQSCHMTPGLVEHEDYPGKIAATSEEREHIWTHWFVGANAFVPELMGNPEIAEIARRRLSMAAKVEIGRLDAGAGQRYFEVTVTNTGAGHKLPTGVTEERQIWLEVEVFDEDGNVIAHFGTTDEQGVIAEDTMILMTKFGDAEGNPTHKIWRAESILSDRRIAPRESDSQAYHVSAVDGPEPRRAVAKLWYRSSHPDFVAELFADAEEPVVVPHVLMAEVEREW